jgi:outer membrane protein assembly factor BamB
LCTEYNIYIAKLIIRLGGVALSLPRVAFGSRQLKKQRPLIKGTDVRRLQQALKHLGFFRARVDGVFGYRTSEAVREFQSFFKLKQNGKVSDDEFNILTELVQAGINKWHTPCHDFAHTGYLPAPITAQLTLSKTWNISDVLWLNSTSDRLIVTTKEQVLAISLISGKVLWRTAKIFPVAAPVISEGQLLIPAQNLEILDLFSGKRLQSISQDNFTTAVAARGGKIYASSWGSLHAFDRKGKALWKYRTSGAFCTSPTLGYDLIYFASYDRNIYCLDDEGTLYWKTKVSDMIKLPLAIWDGKIFAVSQDARIYAINPLLGSLIWQKKFTDDELMMPAFHPDFMLLANYKGEVVAISFQSGQTKWAADLPAAPTTSPVVLKKTCFIGTEGGLVAYDIESLKCRRFLEGETIRAIAPAALSLFVATDKKLVKLVPNQEPHPTRKQ